MKIKNLIIPLLVIILAKATIETLSVPQPAHVVEAAGDWSVTLRAGSGATITFKTQNGRMEGGVQPEVMGESHRLSLLASAHSSIQV